MFKENPSAINRAVLQKEHVDLKHYIHYEVEFYRQKASIQQLTEGDKNTKFFHCLVKGRRQRLQLKRIKRSNKSWAKEDAQIAEEVVYFYKNQFTGLPYFVEFLFLQYILSMITEEENEMLNACFNEEDVRKAVIELHGDCVCDPDGFIGHFYHTCWDIVGKDIVEVFQAFFKGSTLPRSMTHTNLVLLPKKYVIQIFLELRPISLSNFLDKVISTLLHDRLENPLPNIIEQNQSCFVKGRSITNNVLLDQKIITDIRKSEKLAKVVIKLDMDMLMTMLNGVS